MDYRHSLIHMTNRLNAGGSMYSLILLNARSLSVTVGDTKCFIDGKYLLCLSEDDTISTYSGSYSAMNLRFKPYFYNVNLNHGIIATAIYQDMRAKYGYPDFQLFTMRSESFCGILSLSDHEYESAEYYFHRAEQHIMNHGTDWMWSCKTRSEMISILRIAESAYLGESTGEGSEIIRYIRDHIGEELTLDSISRAMGTNRTTLSAEIKELTGMTPMQFVLEERLNQSRPDLLFTHISINEIAEKYGFSDANYYIRAFKKRYGKTPGDYRSAGFAERISHENEYKLTVEKFREQYYKGLGRPILMLKHEQDKQPYADAFLEMLRVCPYYRTDGEYEASVISCFDDPLNVRKRAVEILMDKLKNGDFTVFPTLVYLDACDPAYNTLVRNYKGAYETVTELIDRGVAENETSEAIGRYINACRAFFYIHSAFVIEVMTDFADLFDKLTPETVWVRRYIEAMYLECDNIGMDFAEHLKYIFDVNKHRYREMVLSLVSEITEERKPVIGMTAGEFLDLCNPDKLHIAQLSFCHASPGTVEDVARHAVSEKDPEKQWRIISLFHKQGRHTADMPPQFPFSPDLLIGIIEKYRRSVSINLCDPNPEFTYAWHALAALARMENEQAKAYCLSVYRCSDALSVMSDTALDTLRYNFIPEDSVLLEELIDDENCNALEILLDLISRNTPDAPVDLLYKGYEIAHYELRHCVVDALIGHGMLTVELRRECLCDADPRIRKAAAKCKKQRIITRTEGII